MLRKLRIAISLAVFVLITFYFLDFADLLPKWFHNLTRIQFIPALLAVNAAILLVLFIVTLVFGRVYCSSVCPLGTWQDGVTRLNRTPQKRKFKRYRKPMPLLRWALAGLVALGLIFSLEVVVSLLDPYSTFGRIATHLLKPLYLAGNNLLAALFTSFDNHTFYRVKIPRESIAVLSVTIGMLLLVSYLAYKHGRLYCNTVCPVGTVLGFANRFSIFRIRLSETNCTQCGRCAQVCRAECINVKEKFVDHSRCVNCFNCVGTCDYEALEYGMHEPPATSLKPAKIEKAPADPGRRQFFVSVAAISVLAANDSIFHPEPGLATTFAVKRKNPISPPGSLSLDHFNDRCTACHLCVSKCPSKVLRPSITEYGLKGFLQPIIDPESNYCNFDCVVCTEICPTGAILPLSQKAKHTTQIGKVEFYEDNCIVKTEGKACGSCSEHCPTQAVKMVPYDAHPGLTIPFVTPEICVGCGACEHACPVRPYRAIMVHGNVVHEEAEAIKDEKVDIIIDDFGF